MLVSISATTQRFSLFYAALAPLHPEMEYFFVYSDIYMIPIERCLGIIDAKVQ